MNIEIEKPNPHHLMLRDKTLAKSLNFISRGSLVVGQRTRVEQTLIITQGEL